MFWGFSDGKLAPVVLHQNFLFHFFIHDQRFWKVNY